MREISYREFSRVAHDANIGAGRPTDCQFELTFGCDYRCPHCYTSCYNRKSLLKKELKTEEVKSILVKMRRAGVLWLCLTGGDPLSRADFGDIYSFARRQGFIITVFTNGFRVTPDIVRLWRGAPPFLIEMTLNAASEKLYDGISGCRGSFSRVMRGLDFLQDALLAVKLKMQVTRDNLGELPAVRVLARQRRLSLEPSFLIHPRLDADRAPCRLRAPLPASSFSAQQRIFPSESCHLSRVTSQSRRKPLLFPCAIDSGARLYVDPYGSGFLCCFLRKPKYSLLRLSVARVRKAALDFARQRRYRGEAVCPSCERRADCVACPGLAYLETGDPEAVVAYYCRLAEIS